MKKNLLILAFFVFFVYLDKTNALEVGQKLNDSEAIEEINSIDITIKGKETQLENFLSTKWRTYVKLNDICSKDLNICTVESSNNNSITLTKKYENLSDVYYKTSYLYSTNTYNSLLIVPNSLKFSFGDTMTSPDVSPVKIENNLYVPVRFVSEALGAEVIYEKTPENPKQSVKIDFYSNMNLNFDINFYEPATAENYDFKDLDNGKCYDVIVDVDNSSIYNSKLFTEYDNFVKINYNNNQKTNICLNDNPSKKAISFVFNYKNVPIIYNVDEETVKDYSLDKLYLTGDMSNISKENAVNLKVNYSGKKANFEKYATVKWQGSSSINYDKKNYTIKLFNDENYSEKYKISINDWDSRNKYVLKANYVDYTQARNLVSTKLWGQVVKSRKNVDSRLKKLVNAGAVDGYPIILYINDEYQGLYTFNTAKDEDLFNMDSDDELLIESDSWKDDSLFKSRVDFDDPNTGYEVIYTKNKSNDEIENSINALIDFTINNDGTNFKNGISNYLDVDAAIDYMLFMYYICAADNSAKNLLWASYDSKIWFPSAYDLDSTFSNGNENFTFYTADTMLPSINDDGTITSNTQNGMLLWTRLLNNYRKEIKARYNELRKEILTYDNVVKLFNDFRRKIPDSIYEENLKKWPNLPNSKDDNYNQIYNFIHDREKLMDRIISKF